MDPVRGGVRPPQLAGKKPVKRCSRAARSAGISRSLTPAAQRSVSFGDRPLSSICSVTGSRMRSGSKDCHPSEPSAPTVRCVATMSKRSSRRSRKTWRNSRSDERSAHWTSSSTTSRSESAARHAAGRSPPRREGTGPRRSRPSRPLRQASPLAGRGSAGLGARARKVVVLSLLGRGPRQSVCLATSPEPPVRLPGAFCRYRLPSAEHEAGVTFESRGEKAGENGYFLISSNEQVSLHALQLCNLRRRVMTARLRRHRGSP